MDLEQQVCSLELAKKLKDLSIKQKSLFYINQDNQILFAPNIFHENAVTLREYYSAFTVAELGNMLPKSIQIKTDKEEKEIFSNFRLVTERSLIIDEDKPTEFWSVNYICDTTNQFRNWIFDPLLTKAIYDKNEANVRAKMIIYLLENGLIDNV